MTDEQIQTRIRETLDDYDVGPAMRASGSIPWEADLEALRAALLSLFREAREEAFRAGNVTTTIEVWDGEIVVPEEYRAPTEAQ